MFSIGPQTWCFLCSFFAWSPTHDRYPIPSLEPYTKYQLRVRFAVDPSSLVVEQPAQPSDNATFDSTTSDNNDTGPEGSDTPPDRRRRENHASRSSFATLMIPPTCASIDVGMDVDIDTSVAHERRRRSDAVALADGSIRISGPFGGVIEPALLSGWSDPRFFRTRPRVQPPPVIMLSELSDTHMRVDVVPQRVWAPALFAVHITLLDAGNVTIGSLQLRLNSTSGPALPVAALYQRGVRYIYAQLENSVGLSERSYVYKLPQLTLSAAQQSDEHDNSLSTAEIIGVCIALLALIAFVALLIVYARRRQHSTIFSFPEKDAWHIDRNQVGRTGVRKQGQPRRAFPAHAS